MATLRWLALAIRKQSRRWYQHPPSCIRQALHLGLKEAVSVPQLRRASRAIVAESEHRAARDAPVPLGFDSVQSTGPQ
jgi:hypothetical protein